MLIHKPTNKVHNLRMNNTIAFCIDDPKFPFKRVRGKGTVKIHEDVSYDIPIAKKFIMKSIWSLNHPIAIWLLTEVEKGNEIILEITTMLLLFNLEKCSSNKIIKEYILNLVQSDYSVSQNHGRIYYHHHLGRAQIQRNMLEFWIISLPSPVVETEILCFLDGKE